MIKYIIILLFIVVYTCFGLELGVVANVPAWKHLTYMFQHASWLHLLFNSIAFFALFRVLERFINPWRILLFIIPVATAASFAGSYSLPVVGASGMVYALSGTYLSLCVKRIIVFREMKYLYIYIATLSVALLISFLNPASAALLHLTSLLMGFIIGFVITYKYSNSL